jgi:hypothetical protein
VIEYELATASNTSTLKQAVADLIKQGFEPLGGVAVMHDGKFAAWSQAMKRQRADESEPDTAAV